MTTQPTPTQTPGEGGLTPAGTPRADAARDHLWGHFTRHSTFEPTSAGGAGLNVPTITKGEGAYKIGRAHV